MSKHGSLCVALLILSTTGAAAQEFRGSDAGAGPTSSLPNSNAAKEDFQTTASAVGDVGAADFTGMSNVKVGLGAPTEVAPGVRVQLHNVNGQLTNTGLTIPSLQSPTLGFNTTVGRPAGEFLQIYPSVPATPGTTTAVFTFEDDIQGFGAHFSGLHGPSGPLYVAYNLEDGTAQEIQLTPNASGGADFLGFVAAGQRISSVSIQLREVQRPGLGSVQDVYGIDDITFVYSPEVLMGEAPVVVSSGPTTLELLAQDEPGGLTLGFQGTLASGGISVEYQSVTAALLPTLNIDPTSFLLPGNKAQLWEIDVPPEVFDPEVGVQLTFRYDDTGMSAEEEANLLIYHYKDGTFLGALSPLSHDIDSNLISVRTHSFSTFVAVNEALNAQVPEPTTLLAWSAFGFFGLTVQSLRGCRKAARSAAANPVAK
jgi:hypothetical protein